MLKNNKGITLIALVITIIVLLILAGVSIAMLTGENGILTQATTARDDTAKAEVADKVNMAIQAAYAQFISDADGTLEADDILPIQDIIDQYNNDNKTTDVPTPASGTVSPLTIINNGTTYSVELTQVGNSYTTSKDKVSVPAGD